MFSISFLFNKEWWASLIKDALYINQQSTLNRPKKKKK